MAASRWMVMAERLTPAYQSAVELIDAPLHGLDPDAKVKVAKGKIVARTMVEDIKPFLYPEDDDGC